MRVLDLAVRLGTFAVLVSACSSGGLTGITLSGDKAKSAPSTETTSSEPQAQPDEEKPATEPVAVAGAFLTMSCGPTPTPDGFLQADNVGFGCVITDTATKQKTTATVTDAKVTLVFGDGSTEDAELTVAAADSPMNFFFQISPAKATDLKSLQVTAMVGGVEVDSGPLAKTDNSAIPTGLGTSTSTSKVGDLVFFVTSASYMPGKAPFQSVADANTICTQAAPPGLSSLSHSWKAVLGSPNTPIKLSVTILGGVVNLKNQNIAAKPGDFWNRPTKFDLYYENGNAVESADVAWTGSSTGSDGNCLGWTSNSSADSGASGKAKENDDKWYDKGAKACDTALHLYCLSQE